VPDPESQFGPAQSQPHQVGWFWRLFGLYNKQHHPIPAEFDEPDELLSTGRIYEWWQKQFSISSDRRERYRIFEEMDTFDLIMAILDVYSEETTQPDYDRGQSVWIESKSANMVKAGMECLRNVQAEDRITAITRRMLKYGDAFRRLIYQTGKGVLGWKHASTASVHRVEDKFSRLIGFREDGKTFRHKKRPISWPWDYLHYRLLGKYEETGYGTSFCENLFRPWRQLTLGEDALLMYRLRRAPDRNMVFVDVGNMEDHDAMEYLNAWRKRFRKHEFIDPSSPEYKKQYNPLTPIEDVFMPTREGNNSRVDNLAGSANMGEIYDIDHYRRKFFGAAKVPQAYFGFEGDINAKATLMQQDVRFARTCKRIRKSQLYAFRQLLDVHYTLLPNTPGDMSYDFTQQGNEYLVQMSPISYLDEWERIELVQLRYQLVDSMANLSQSLQIDAKTWAVYVLVNFAKLPEDLVTKLIKQTPKGPPGGEGGEEGGEFESGITAKQRANILDKHGPDVLRQVTEGMDMNAWEPSKKEVKIMSEALHQSPMLRKVLGDITEVSMEDMVDIQTDPSVLPPTTGGKIIVDTVGNDKAAKQLEEDVAALQDGSIVMEGLDSKDIPEGNDDAPKPGDYGQVNEGL